MGRLDGKVAIVTGAAQGIGLSVAMAYLDQGNTAEAGALFAAIAKDKGTSETLRSRTRQMAGLLGVDAIDDVDTVLNRPQAAGE